MMKITPFLIALFAAGPVFAHPGHVAEVLGHNHWVAGAAIGVAVAVGVWGALKGQSAKGSGEAEAELETEDAQEA